MLSKATANAQSKPRASGLASGSSGGGAVSGSGAPGGAQGAGTGAVATSGALLRLESTQEAAEDSPDVLAPAAGCARGSVARVTGGTRHAKLHALRCPTTCHRHHRRTTVTVAGPAPGDPRSESWVVRPLLGGFQAPFPPAVTHRPLLSALAAAID